MSFRLDSPLFSTFTPALRPPRGPEDVLSIFRERINPQEDIRSGRKEVDSGRAKRSPVEVAECHKREHEYTRDTGVFKKEKMSVRRGMDTVA